jgi:uncharacterized protein YciU (UPF0263 family)
VRPSYHVVRLHDTLADRRAVLEEFAGTKTKFWLLNVRMNRRVMVKFAREGTGEDWSEKVAYELGKALLVPCPRVDLCEVMMERAVLCWDFLTQGSSVDGSSEQSLIHGNELLFRVNDQYPAEVRYGVVQHTTDAVADVLSNARPIWPRAAGAKEAIRDGFDTFVGYLMLDALIGNTDRHHENWGVVSQRTATGHLLRIAPSYDHASSLGRELTDEKRMGRLGPQGRGTVQDYANKANSALWSRSGSKLSTVEALAEAAAVRPSAFEMWKSILRRTTLERLHREVERVPPSRLSDVGKRFACELISHNYQRILQLSL